ncbi:hypothetical protein [Sphingobacterium athyrii]|nr:hypothetical protein [Sphingobacterium athyrii]
MDASLSQDQSVNGIKNLLSLPGIGPYSTALLITLNERKMQTILK